MKEKRRNIVYIDPDVTYFEGQQKKLKQKGLQNYYYPFDDFWEAMHFIEKQFITNRKKLHYILVDEQMLGKQHTAPIGKLSGFSSFLDKLEIIVCTTQNSADLRNKIMQYSFISAFLVKPIPEEYIEFLITGVSSVV
jgi:response regulator RpfG family c-di-GMP phosphodiesterase